MSPLIPSGSFILTFNKLPKRLGRQIVLKHKRYGLIVKTLCKIDNKGTMWCQGESHSSVSVEQIGPVAKQQVLGFVLWIFKDK